jgi:tRNA (adenine22-N1)-methyltransferase
LADIGTDHAYLPIALCQEGKIESAVAIDIHLGPYQSALAAVRECKLEKKIVVRLGNGLQPLLPGEADTLSLAGMGGKTMLEIIFAREDILAGVADLVLQPQGLEYEVRRTLLNAGWLLKEECLVEEEARIYNVMAFSRYTGCGRLEIEKMKKKWIKALLEAGQEEQDEEAALDRDYGNSATETGKQRKTELACSLFWSLGPLILHKPDPLLGKFVQEHIAVLSRKEKQMGKSEKPAVKIRRQEVLFQLSLLKILQRSLLD